MIGGGNTAIDAATCSRRLGVPSVTMYYRRGAERMTAYDFEIEFAKLEGVEFRTFVLPKRIVVEDGRVAGLELISTDPDGSARPLPGTERVVPADTVILAIGQTRHVALLDAFGVTHDVNGIATVDDAMRTNRPRVFAAGDCMFRPGGTDAMVVEAAQRGKVAAASVDAFAARGGALMADLSIDLAGIRSPNPFWLASAPPTNSGYQVMRAFAAGWGGAVWKTLALEPIVNVTSRFAGYNIGAYRMAGHEQHRADHRPSARREPARDRRVQGGVSRIARSSPR